MLSVFCIKFNLYCWLETIASFDFFFFFFFFFLLTFFFTLLLQVYSPSPDEYRQDSPQYHSPKQGLYESYMYGKLNCLEHYYTLYFIISPLNVRLWIYNIQFLLQKDFMKWRKFLCTIFLKIQYFALVFSLSLSLRSV